MWVSAKVRIAPIRSSAQKMALNLYKMEVLFWALNPKPFGMMIILVTTVFIRGCRGREASGLESLAAMGAGGIARDFGH